MNLDTLRGQFPILKTPMMGHPLAYLDNAATTQKPLSVLESMDHFYRHHNANVHRGTHDLTQQATNLYEQSRDKVADFIGAPHSEQCIFTRGTTEAINLVAYGISSDLGPEDEILVSQTEHHSNFVPWQVLCARTGAQFKIIPCLDSGDLDLNAYESLLGPKTKMVALGHASNALGTIHPIQKMIEMAHQKNIPVLIDGAQAMSHMPVDVQALDCDFYAFSGHKMFGPTGVGVLYGKKHWLEKLPPFQLGGEMILQVTDTTTTFNQVPYKFEAGTMPIAEIIGLGAAIDFMHSVGFDAIQQHEADILAYATEKLKQIPGLRMIGTSKNKVSLISFVFDNIHPHDVGTIVNEHGIALRTGQHCAEPLMRRFKVPATNRASFALYNTREEVDRLLKALKDVQRIFA